MAVTKGHGNPNWTRDEIILALDLYFDCGARIPSAEDSRICELSELLRSFPYHSFAARKPSFRNPAGVVFKLQNLRQVATAKGLSNVSQADRKIWNELGSDPKHTKELAMLIRAGIEVVSDLREDCLESDLFAEGRLVTEAHLRRERDPRLRERLLSDRRRKSALACEICGRKPYVTDVDLCDSIFEAHHVVPLAAGAERKTSLGDMALLCACCHRVIHRAIAIAGSWIAVEQAKTLLCQSDA